MPTVLFYLLSPTPTPPVCGCPKNAVPPCERGKDHVPFPQLPSESEKVCELPETWWEMHMLGQGTEASALLRIAESVLPATLASEEALTSLLVPPPLPVEAAFVVSHR